MSTVESEPVSAANELSIVDSSKQQIITVTAKVIDEMKSLADQITLRGVIRDGLDVLIEDSDAMLSDKDGLKKLKEARQRAVKARTKCVEEHKLAKEEAQRTVTAVDAQKRALVKRIEIEIEAPLEALEELVEGELDRRAKEKADRIYAARKQMLLDVAGEEFGTQDEEYVRSLDEDAFQKLVIKVSADKKRAFEAEQERQKLEAAAIAERDRIRFEAEKLAEQNRIEQERLAEERRQFEAQKAEADRLRKIEQDKADALRRELELAEQERQRIENERISEAQKRLEAQQAEIDEQRRKMKEESDRVEADRIRREQEAEEAVRRAEQAKIDEANRVEAERIAAEESERQAEIDRLELGRKQAEADAAAELAKKECEAREQKAFEWIDLAANLIVDFVTSSHGSRESVVEGVAKIIRDEFDKADIQ